MSRGWSRHGIHRARRSTKRGLRRRRAHEAQNSSLVNLPMARITARAVIVLPTNAIVFRGAAETSEGEKDTRSSCAGTEVDDRLRVVVLVGSLPEVPPRGRALDCGRAGISVATMGLWWCFVRSNGADWGDRWPIGDPGSVFGLGHRDDVVMAAAGEDVHPLWGAAVS